MKVNVELNNTTNVNSDTKEDKTNINVVYGTGKGEDIKFSVNSELTISKNVQVKEFDDKYAKDISEFSESELSLIEYKATNIYQSIINDFMKSPYYNLNDYSDYYSDYNYNL